MLTSIINNPPHPKFVVIEDSLKEDGKDIFNYIYQNHAKNFRVYYFIFSGKYRTQNTPFPKVMVHNFTSDIKGWLSQCKPDFKQVVEDIKDNAVVLIDSLAHMILQYDISATYRLLNCLKQKPNIIQITTLLHVDLLQNPEKTLKFLEHLSTLCITREPKFNSSNKRISYIYKKTGGKVIKQIEEYLFHNGNMISIAVKKVDPKTLVEQNIKKTLPDHLTTFRISLDEKEKESRSKVVLPYLPKEIFGGKEEESGKIIYKFDEADDWDEEDPDDDLDI